MNLDEAYSASASSQRYTSNIYEVVTRQSISMSVRQVLKANQIVAVVPDARKAPAAKLSLEGTSGRWRRRRPGNPSGDDRVSRHTLHRAAQTCDDFCVYRGRISVTGSTPVRFLRSAGGSAGVVRVDGDQLHRPPDALDPGAVPEAGYRWTNADYANIAIAFRVSVPLGQTLWGRLIDRIGAAGLTIGVMWYPIVSVLTSLASGLTSFTVCRFLLGAGESANWPGASRPCPSGFPSASAPSRRHSTTAGPPSEERSRRF